MKTLFICLHCFFFYFVTTQESIGYPVQSITVFAVILKYKNGLALVNDQTKKTPENILLLLHALQFLFKDRKKSAFHAPIHKLKLTYLFWSFRV